MNKTLALVITVVIIYAFIYYFNSHNNYEHFVIGKVCSNPLAKNYKSSINLSPNETYDDCVCEFNENVVCGRYFSSNYVKPNYSNSTKRCNNKNAYNFEINQKIPDETLCQFENNNVCCFPVSMTNINSIYDIIDNPDEFQSIINNEGTIAYNNILSVGPCVPKHKNRSQKLDLYYRLFNRSAIQNMHTSAYDPIFNIWDSSGKVTNTQLTESYGSIVRTINFTEDGLDTKIDVLGYGLKTDHNISYTELVEKMTTKWLQGRIKHVALAISADCKKYAIGIGKTKDLAMDIAMMNAILYDHPNIESNNHVDVDMPYTRTIHLLEKAKMMDIDTYSQIKKDISDKKIVSDHDILLSKYKDKLIENEDNPVAILMINNDRYFKYDNKSEIIEKCADKLQTIEPICFSDDKNNCSEVTMLRYDGNKCSILQKDANLIANSTHNFSKLSDNLKKEIMINSPYKMIHSIAKNANCNKNGVTCFVHSINGERFCN